jgi:hypothetical protein
MPASLADLQTFKTVLGRLDAERPAGSGQRLGQTEYQPRGSDIAKRLALEIARRRANARVLLTGQIGVGKSSELGNFFREFTHRDSSTPLIFCDLEKDEHPERCGATGVFLTIIRDCWGATRRFTSGRQSLNEVRDDILTRLIDWLKGQRSNRDSVTFRFGGMDFVVQLRDRDRALALVLGKAAQHEAVSSPSDRFGLVPDVLVLLLNKLLNWVAARCGGRNPVVIIDHVDKIRDSGAAEDVLIKAVPQWNRIQASIIMTAPFEYTLGDLRNSIEAKWNRPLMVYPLEIPSLTNGEIPKIYSRIAKVAGLEPFIDDEILRQIAHYSGGILRLFVQFLIQTAKEAHLAGHARIELSDARQVIFDAERAYQDYSPRDLESLEEISKHGTGLREAATLLRSPIGLIVGEPSKGEHSLLIHPLAQQVLNRYQKTRKAVG